MLAGWRTPGRPSLTSAGAAGQPGLPRARRIDPRALRRADRRAARPTSTSASAGRWAPSSNPQPRRAEAWRSGRSLTDVEQSLAALRAYVATVFAPAIGPEEAAKVDATFDAALAAVGRVGEPIDVAVATTQGRVRVEALQTAVRHVQTEIAEHVGPALGVTSGFNASDGD